MYYREAMNVVADLPELTDHLIPAASATYDVGSSSKKWRDLYLSRNATIGGTLGVTGAATFSSTVTTGALLVTGAITATTTITSSQNMISTLNVEARGAGTTLLMGTTPTNGFYYRNTSALSLGNGFVNRLANDGLAITGKKNNASGAVAVGIGAVLNVTTANESTVNDNYTPLEVAYETSDASSSAGYYKLFCFKKRSLRWVKTSTVAAMPASPEAGDVALVTDANSDGGGSNEYTLALYNGSAWIDLRSNAVLA